MRLLDDARTGQSATLVIRGEAGIGKSTLLGYIAEQAEGMRILRTTGIEAESDLAFAGLYGLLRPVLGFLDTLPQTQSAALGGALGLAPSASPDRFLVSAAVLGLIAAAAEEEPVLCLVDDAQWLDRASADALVFAARRLGADPVAVVFAAREGDPRRFDASGLPELSLTGLNQDAAAEVLAEHTEGASPEIRTRLLAEARGNPLALIELPSGLTPAQLSGIEPLPDAIPLTPRLHALFRQRIERLPQDTQLALLIAALEETGEIHVVLRAAAEMGLSAADLDPAERAELIFTDAATIRFRHPLVRSALYGSATISGRQRAHAALAAALSDSEHSDRRVWHQAMATLRADEGIASALEASARRAQAKAAHASAATSFVRAAELSVEESARVRRIAEAAHAAWDAGDPDRARAAITRALPHGEGEVRAQLLHLSGVIESRSGSLRESHRVLLAAAEATDDPSFQLTVLCEAAEAASYAGEFAEQARLSELACRIPPASERDRFLQDLAGGFLALYRRDHREARTRFSEVLERADAFDDPMMWLWASNAAAAAGGWGEGLPYATRAVELARDRGLLSILPRALERQGGELLWTSRFDHALAAAEEGYRLSSDMGFPSPWNLMTMAFVEAIRGREDAAQAHTDQILATGEDTGGLFLMSRAHFTLAFIDVVAGRWEQATDRLLAVTTPGDESFHPITARAATPELAEAAVRDGREDEVSDALATFRSWVSATESEFGTSLLSRCEALLRTRDPEDAFAESLAHESALPPFQKARGRLLYGEWLRRERRRIDARVHLRAALEVFRTLGAEPWEERAAAELRAAGETARRRDASTLDDLTPQELQIAGLVTQGLTNRKIAAQLYQSPRTIEYHLRKIFSKLGIASRTDLVRQGLPRRDSG